MYPKIYLAIDNCFASKRWTTPEEWMSVIKELGIYYVEASADNECDPLYMGEGYMKKWVDDVKRATDKTSVKVANLYSGHGTYATLGLAHIDASVRERFLTKWLYPMTQTAASLDAGLGFFCHAFSDSVLQDKSRYAEFRDNLYQSLADLSAYALSCGCSYTGVEQMYSPHQIPWTLKGSKELINSVYEKSKNPFYITVDTGHQSGQRKFVMPDKNKIEEAKKEYKNGGFLPELWLGPKTAYEMFCNDYPTDEIVREMKEYPHMFAGYDDGDTYNWLKAFGCYSPIIHLQQTNGKSSSHLAFTEENNKLGIIEGKKVLSAIKDAYDNEGCCNVPRCDKIFLTLEMFVGTADINRAALKKLRESADYWRSFIPVDGKPLDELV